MPSLLRRLPSSVTVEVDSREQYPLLFPATFRWWRGDESQVVVVKTEVIGLPFGDYRLKEAPTLCVVERKGSVREVAKNLLDPKDSARQRRAFQRLVEGCAFPVLLLEMKPSDFAYDKPDEVDTNKVTQRLFRTVADFGLNIIMLPRSNTTATRRTTGGVVLDMLVAHSKLEDV